MNFSKLYKSITLLVVTASSSTQMFGMDQFTQSNLQNELVNASEVITKEIVQPGRIARALAFTKGVAGSCKGALGSAATCALETAKAHPYYTTGAAIALGTATVGASVYGYKKYKNRKTQQQEPQPTHPDMIVMKYPEQDDETTPSLFSKIIHSRPAQVTALGATGLIAGAGYKYQPLMSGISAAGSKVAETVAAHPYVAGAVIGVPTLGTALYKGYQNRSALKDAAFSKKGKIALGTTATVTTLGGASALVANKYFGVTASGVKNSAMSLLSNGIEMVKNHKVAAGIAAGSLAIGGAYKFGPKVYRKLTGKTDKEAYSSLENSIEQLQRTSRNSQSEKRTQTQKQVQNAIDELNILLSQQQAQQQPQPFFRLVPNNETNSTKNISLRPKAKTK